MSTAAPLLPAPAAHGWAATRTARTREGQTLVELRATEEKGTWVVACDVQPTRPGAEQVSRGPYVFASENEARRFVDEAALALEYLGCEVD